MRRVGLRGEVGKFHVDELFEYVGIEDATVVDPATCRRVCAQ